MSNGSSRRGFLLAGAAGAAMSISGLAVEAASYQKEKESSESIEDLRESVLEHDRVVVSDSNDVSAGFSYLPGSGYIAELEVEFDVNLEQYDGVRHLSENEPELINEAAQIFGEMVDELDASEYKLMHSDGDDSFNIDISDQNMTDPEQAYLEAIEDGDAIWNVY